MATPNGQQPRPMPQKRPSRRMIALLVGLICAIVLAGVAIFAVPPIVASFGSHTSNATVPTGDVPMFGFDAQNTRTNAAEHILTYTSVSHLVADWVSPPTGGSIFSSPVVANGVIYVGSFDGLLYAFNAASCGKPSCSPLWTSTPTGDRIFSTPAVANGVVYIGSFDHKLYAFNANGCGNATCSPLWVSTPTGDYIDTSPVASEGIVYIGSRDHKLYAFNASGCGSSTCPPLWSSAIVGSDYFSSPAVAGGIVYIGSINQDTGLGQLLAYKANGCGHATCSPIWTASPPQVGTSSQCSHAS